MKTLFQIGFHAALLAIVGILGAIPAEAVFHQDSIPPTLLVIEAENYDSVIAGGSHGWVESGSAGFSGHGAMEAMPSNGTLIAEGYTAASPRMDYAVNITQPGVLYLWVRGWARNYGSDSVHVGVDGVGQASGKRIDFFSIGDYSWSGERKNASGERVRSTLTIDTPGAHTINVWMREDGFVIDRFLLSADPGFVPVGAGPEESPTTVNGDLDFRPVEDQYARAGEVVSFGVSLINAESGTSLSAAELPSGARFDDHGDGSGSFRWAIPDGIGTEDVHAVTFMGADEAGRIAISTVKIHVAEAVVLSEGFSDGRMRGWTVHDETLLASDWRVEADGTGDFELRQKNFVGRHAGAGALEGIYHRGSYAKLDASGGLADYRFGAVMRTVSEDADECGLMWRYRDRDNYFRFTTSYRDGISLFQKKVSGVWSTLGKHPRGYARGENLHIEIVAWSGFTSVAVNGVRLFAGYEPVLGQGGVAVYGRNECAFDDVSLQTGRPEPMVVIADPADRSAVPSLSATIRAVVVDPPPGAAVEFRMDGVPCARIPATGTGLLQGRCAVPRAGVYELEAALLSEERLLDVDTRPEVGLGGGSYTALGDSVSNGKGDDYERDGTSHSGWRVARQGYQSNLMDALYGAGREPFVPVIFNAAVGGDGATHLRERIASILEQHGESDHFLVQIGTNDAGGSMPRDSGLDCVGGGCSSSYFQLLQESVDTLRAAGKTVWVALPPPRFGDSSNTEPYSDPDAMFANHAIREYGEVVRTRVTGRRLGPDLYDYFLEQENRFSLFADNLHPNALGHYLLAHLWRNALSGEVDLPPVVEGLRLRMNSEGALVTPFPYKQNLLEAGDPCFVDADYRLVEIPPVLKDGRWIVTANRDRNRTHSDYLSFDVPGGGEASVYVAYDASARTLPLWLQQDFVPTGEEVLIDHPDAPAMALYRRDQVSGPVVIGAAASGETGAATNFLVAVKF